MATIANLCENKDLVRVDGQKLIPNYAPRRTMFLYPSAHNAVLNGLPKWRSYWEPDVSAKEQFITLLRRYFRGFSFQTPEEIRLVNPMGNGVWEFKTPDLRLFGWFYEQDCFIATHLCEVVSVKESNLYAGLSGEAANWRQKLNLNEPKFVPGERLNEVLSA